MEKSKHCAISFTCYLIGQGSLLTKLYIYHIGVTDIQIMVLKGLGGGHSDVVPRFPLKEGATTPFTVGTAVK